MNNWIIEEWRYRYYDTSYTLPQFQMDDGDRFKIQAAVNVLENYEGEPVLDWARTLLMQIGSGVFGSDSSSVVSFQSNPDLKGITLFGELLKAIINKKVLKIEYGMWASASRKMCSITNGQSMASRLS